jgi:hypothetical protein
MNKEDFDFLHRLKATFAEGRSLRNSLISAHVQALTDEQANKEAHDLWWRFKRAIDSAEEKARNEFRYDCRRDQFLDTEAATKFQNSVELLHLVIQRHSLVLLHKCMEDTAMAEEARKPAPSYKDEYQAILRHVFDLREYLTVASVEYELRQLAEEMSELQSLPYEWMTAWVSSRISLRRQEPLQDSLKELRVGETLRAAGGGNIGNDWMVSILCEIDNFLPQVSKLQDFGKLPRNIAESVEKQLASDNVRLRKEKLKAISIEATSNMGMDLKNPFNAYEDFIAREAAPQEEEERLHLLKEVQSRLSPVEWCVFVADTLWKKKKPTSAEIGKTLGISADMVRYHRGQCKKKLMDYRNPQ